VVEIVSEQLPPELGWGEVLLLVKYAPISPADTYSARLGGVYGSDSVEPPFVCGHDGVAEVAKVGRPAGAAFGL
jgi:trans-2-enoyl-CoA reductase